MKVFPSLVALALSMLASPAFALDPGMVVAADLKIGDSSAPMKLTVKGVEDYLLREIHSDAPYDQRHARLDKVHYSMVSAFNELAIGADHIVARKDLVEHDRREVHRRIDFTVSTKEGDERWSCTLDIDPSLNLIGMGFCSSPKHSTAQQRDDLDADELFPAFQLSDYVSPM